MFALFASLSLAVSIVFAVRVVVFVAVVVFIVVVRVPHVPPLRLASRVPQWKGNLIGS